MSIEQDEQSGFGEAFSDEPISQEVASEETQADEQGEVEAVTDEVVPDLRNVSYEDFQALSERFNAISNLPEELRKVQGKYGELHRTLQQQAPKSVSLNADKLTRLRANYPEIADDLASDLSEALQVSANSQSFDPSQFEEVISSRVTQATSALDQKVQVLTLSLEHKDWKQVANSPEFQQWKSALPADEQHQLDNSWDAGYLAEKISAFKATVKPAAPVETPKQAMKSKLIQAAVTPVGSRSAAPAIDSEAEAFRRATSGA